MSPEIPPAASRGRQFDTPEAIFDLVREYRQSPTNTASAMTADQWARAWMAEWQRANRVEAVVAEADEMLSRLHDIMWSNHSPFNEWEGEDGRRAALNVVVWEIHDLLREQPSGGCGCSIGTFNEGCAVCMAALDAIHHGPLRRDYSIIRTEDDPWRAALQRAAYVVHHLVERVPEFTGVIGPGGEREDDSIRDDLHAEADEWKAIANAR